MRPRTTSSSRAHLQTKNQHYIYHTFRFESSKSEASKSDMAKTHNLTKHCRLAYSNGTDPVSGLPWKAPSSWSAYDPRWRPWYEKCKQAGQNVWSSIYEFAPDNPNDPETRENSTPKSRPTFHGKSSPLFQRKIVRNQGPLKKLIGHRNHGK